MKYTFLYVRNVLLLIFRDIGTRIIHFKDKNKTNKQILSREIRVTILIYFEYETGNEKDNLKTLKFKYQIALNTSYINRICLLHYQFKLIKVFEHAHCVLGSMHVYRNDS